MAADVPGFGRGSRHEGGSLHWSSCPTLIYFHFGASSLPSTGSRILKSRATLVQLLGRINLPFFSGEPRVLVWLHRVGFQSSFQQVLMLSVKFCIFTCFHTSNSEPFLGSTERISMLQFDIRHLDFRLLGSSKPVSTSSSAFHLHKFVDIPCLL